MGRHGYGGDFWHIGTFAEMVGMTIPEAMKYINEKKLKQKESADMKYG